jgi:hypothetical protein
MGFFESLDPDQLLTAGAFITYLLYQNKEAAKRNDKLEADKQELINKYIAKSEKSNNDLMEATRIFDKLIQVNK